MHLTNALLYLVQCHFQNKPTSIRKAAAIHMDNKYSTLNRIWKQYSMQDVLKTQTEADAMLYACRISKPKVVFVFAFCFLLFVCLFTCLYDISCVQLGNPLWVNHVNAFHEMLMVSLIKHMAVRMAGSLHIWYVSVRQCDCILALCRTTTSLSRTSLFP